MDQITQPGQGDQGRDSTPPQVTPPTASFDSFKNDLGAYLDQHGSILSGDSTASAPVFVDESPAPSPTAEHVPWYSRVLKGAGQIIVHPVETAKSVGRGAAKAAQSTAHLAADLFAHVTDDGQDPFWNWYNKNVRDRANAAGGLAKTLFGGPSGDEMMQWYSEHVDHTADEARRSLLGPDAQDGPQAFVESTSQFVTGMIGASRLMKLGKGASLVGRLAIGTTEGAVADFTAFMPTQERLSNMVANGPDWFGRPVAEFLSTKETDSELTARLKQAGEGAILGAPFMVGLEGLSKLYRAIMPSNAARAAALSTRAQRTAAAAEAGTINKELATRSVQQDMAAAERELVTPDPNDLVHVERASDGRYALVERGGKYDPKSPHFDTEGEANAHAASVNEAGRNAGMAPGTVHADAADPLDEAAHFRRADEAGRPRRAVPQADQNGGGNGPINPAAANAYKAEALARLTPEARAEWQRVVHQLENGADAADVEKLMDGSTINFNYVQAPEDVLASIKALSEALPAELRTKGVPIQTNAQTVALANNLSRDIAPQQWVQYAQRIFQNSEQLPQQITAMRAWLLQMGKKTRDIARLADMFPDNPVAQKNLAEALQTLADLHGSVKGTGTNTARALQAHQIEASAETVAAGTAKANPATHRAPGDPRSVIAGRTSAELRALARQVFLSDGDPAEILDAILTPRSKTPKGVRPQTWFDRIHSFRVESMLSGPVTHVTNMTSNMISMLQRPAEYFWSGVRTNNPAMRQAGSDMLGGLWQSLGDSWRAAKKAFSAGENVLDPGRTHVGQEYGQEAFSKAWKDQNWLQRVYHAPSRLLMTTDEFFQQMNYRMNLRAQILRQARASGVTDSKVLAERLNQQMRFGFNPEGMAVNPLSLEYSRIGTFKNDLGEHTVGKWLQEGARDHAWVRVIMPFVRTPVNLFRYAWERTPFLANFSKIVKADLEAGGERAALARAKQEMGVAFWGSASMLALTGNITGRGPTDPALRRQWLDAGNKPYSVRIPGGSWISFRRADPTFSMFGVVADIAQMTRDLPEKDFTQLATMTVAAVMANITNKTFMQGLSQTLDAMSSGDPHVVERTWRSFVGSFIPNIANQTNPDDVVREVHSVLDEVYSRIPGFSTTLEPHRNLFGEPVLGPPGDQGAYNPFTVTPAHKADDVSDDLIALGRALSMPPKALKGGIDLTDRTAFASNSQAGQRQSPYDRYLELLGQEHDGLPTLRSALTDMVRSDEYKNAASGNEVNVGGTRYLMANAIVEAHKGAAWARVLAEYPALVQAMTDAAVQNAQGFVSSQPADNTSLESITNLLK